MTIFVFNNKKMMKKLLFSLLISASATAFAQHSTLVVADGMLASSTFVKANAKNIKAQKTYAANAALPQTLSNFAEAGKKGLISVTLKENHYDRISLAEMNLQNDLDAQNPVLFDGNLIKNTEIKILGNVMSQTEVQIVDGKKVLSISSQPKS